MNTYNDSSLSLGSSRHFATRTGFDQVFAPTEIFPSLNPHSVIAIKGSVNDKHTVVSGLGCGVLYQIINSLLHHSLLHMHHDLNTLYFTLNCIKYNIVNHSTVSSCLLYHLEILNILNTIAQNNKLVKKNLGFERKRFN